MANHSATKKDVRQAAKRRERNKFYGKTTRNAIRDLKEIKGQKEAGEKLPEIASMIDKLAKKNIIHWKKAANQKGLERNIIDADAVLNREEIEDVAMEHEERVCAAIPTTG